MLNALLSFSTVVAVLLKAWRRVQPTIVRNGKTSTRVRIQTNPLQTKFWLILTMTMTMKTMMLIATALVMLELKIRILREMPSGKKNEQFFYSMAIVLLLLVSLLFQISHVKIVWCWYNNVMRFDVNHICVCTVCTCSVIWSKNANYTKEIPTRFKFFAFLLIHEADHSPAR